MRNLIPSRCGAFAIKTAHCGVRPLIYLFGVEIFGLAIFAIPPGKQGIILFPLGQFGYGEGAVASFDEASIGVVVHEVECRPYGSREIKVDGACGLREMRRAKREKWLSAEFGSHR